MDEITIPGPLDMHVHFRQGEMLRNVVPLTAGSFAAAMAMPNTSPIVDTPGRVVEYLDEIRTAAKAGGCPDFRPYGTLYFQTHFNEEFLEGAKPHILAIKFYPKGMTTNSSHGCDPEDPAVLDVLNVMEKLGIILSVHPESFGYHEDREERFGKFVDFWVGAFPKLKIVLEHLSDRRSLRLLDYPNVFATVTPQHLLLTGDDWVGPPLRPHLYCLPVIKRPEDRTALLRAVTGDFAHKFMLGTDSAPHPATAKESACGCAGIFTAPIALQLYAQAFDGVGAMDRLQAFASDNARRIYDIDPPNSLAVKLIRKPFAVPYHYGQVVPMWAGEVLGWQIEL